MFSIVNYICRCLSCQPIECRVEEIKRDTYCSKLTCNEVITTTLSPSTTTSMQTSDSDSLVLVPIFLTVLTMSICIVIILRKKRLCTFKTEDNDENLFLLNNDYDNNHNNHIELVNIDF